MDERIDEGRLDRTDFNIARKEDIQTHVHNLRQLKTIVNRGLSSLMAFEIRIGFIIDEFEQASMPILGSDPLHRPEFLTLAQAAHKLGITTVELRKDRSRFPKPVEPAG